MEERTARTSDQHHRQRSVPSKNVPETEAILNGVPGASVLSRVVRVSKNVKENVQIHPQSEPEKTAST